MVAVPAAANAYQRRKANIKNRVSASAKATRRVIGAISASWPLGSAMRRARRSASRSAQTVSTSPPTSGMPRAATAIAAGNAAKTAATPSVRLPMPSSGGLAPATFSRKRAKGRPSPACGRGPG